MKLVTRFSEAASIAGVSMFQLRNWIERKQISLKALSMEGSHRRFCILDIIRIAVVGRLVRFGLHPIDADQKATELFILAGLTDDDIEPKRSSFIIGWSEKNGWQICGENLFHKNAQWRPLAIQDAYLAIDIWWIAKMVREREYPKIAAILNSAHGEEISKKGG